MAKQVINLLYRGGSYDHFVVASTSNCVEYRSPDRTIDLRPNTRLSRKEVDLMIERANIDGSSLIVNIK